MKSCKHEAIKVTEKDIIDVTYAIEKAEIHYKIWDTEVLGTSDFLSAECADCNKEFTLKELPKELREIYENL